MHARNHWKCTPLHEAVVATCIEVHIELCTLLIDGGSDLEARNEWGRTPLHEAVVSKNTELCKLLLDRGADVTADSAENFSFSLDPYYDDVTRASERLSPLHLAASKQYGGSTELCRLLVERGAQTSVENAWGRTPLEEALLNGHTALSTVLRRDTPLHDAVDAENTELCTLLLDQGADVNAANDDLTTPLHLAVFKQDYELCTLLLDRGADVNAVDEDLVTPLHLAVVHQNIELCTLLLDRGSTLDAKDDCGDTHLHEAVREENAELCNLLLDRGADVNAVNDDLTTPLQFAVVHQNIRVVHPSPRQRKYAGGRGRLG